LELGYDLIPLVDKDNGAELKKLIVRTALDLGIVIPEVRIIDNTQLEYSEYFFKLNGVDAAGGNLRMGQYLCINPGQVKTKIKGEESSDPVFGFPVL